MRTCEHTFEALNEKWDTLWPHTNENYKCARVYKRATLVSAYTLGGSVAYTVIHSIKPEFTGNGK